MKVFAGFTAIFLVNAFLLLSASHLFPSSYIITSFLGSWWLSLIVSSLTWTIIIFFTQTIADLLEIKIKKGFEQMIAYFISNFIAIWGVGRIGLGFGVRSIVWVLALAITANIIQFGVWRILAKLGIMKA